jgi:type II secretory pathway pseudopilin PulG
MNFPQSNHGKRSSFAFTIIELLVAITITAAISAMMVTIVTNVLGAWSRSSATLSTGNQARLILDQIAVDLQGAVLRNSTDVTFAATISEDQTGVNSGQGDANASSASWSGSDVKPGDTAAPNGSLLLNPTDRDLANYRFGQAGTWLRFFTVPADNSSTALSDASAPRAVAYQIVRNQVGSGTAPYTYQLFRSEVRPYGTSPTTIGKSSFTQGYDLFAANLYNSPADVSFGANTNVGDAGCIRRPRPEYVIGNGVIDFGVKVFALSIDTRDIDADGNVTESILYEIFPVDRRISDANSSIRRVMAATNLTTKTQPNVALPSGNFAAADTSYGYPSVVEVMLRILTPEGIQIIQSYEADPARFGGASAAKWWELAEQNSKVYVRRVEVRSTAL